MSTTVVLLYVNNSLLLSDWTVDYTCVRKCVEIKLNV
jgi:hypothetical protein